MLSVQRRVPDPRAAALGAAIRVYNAPALHRVLPMPAALRLVRSRTERCWKDPTTRFQAETHMRFLVGRSGSSVGMDVLARRYLYEYFLFDELNCRPWRFGHDRIEHLDRFVEAAAEGRGVIVHFLHHAQYGGVLTAFPQAGHQLSLCAHHELLATRHPGHRQFVRFLHRGGVGTFPAKGSLPHMLDLLAAGRNVAIACDARGSTRVHFLGREVMAASGTWRLAQLSGAPVVPVSAVPDGAGQRVVVHPAIDPRGTTDGPALLQQVLDSHEPVVASRPEAYRRPFLGWGAVPEDLAELASDDPRLGVMHV